MSPARFPLPFRKVPEPVPNSKPGERAELIFLPLWNQFSAVAAEPRTTTAPG